MAIPVESNYQNQFSSDLDVEKVRSFFSDYSRSVGALFPGLESFTNIEGESYRWLFEKIGYNGLEFQVEIATRFESTSNQVIICPVEGQGNTRLEGSLSFSPLETRTSVDLTFHLEGELPLPRLMKSVVAPKVEEALRKLFDQYVSDLEKALKA